MTAKTLELGSVVVPLWASMQIRQRFWLLGGATTLRMMNGAGKRQTHWRRLAKTISGPGNIPAGLDELDYGQPLTLKCVAQRSITAAGNVITIPAARRSDAGHLPHGFAESVGGAGQAGVGGADGDFAFQAVEAFLELADAGGVGNG